MTVLEFAKKYKEANKNNKSDVLEEITISTYEPIEMKSQAIENIIASIITYENGIPTYDSITKYLAFTLGAIALYTNLVFEENKSFIEYDALAEAGLLTIIFETIGPDYSDFLEFFNMRFNDYMRENASFEAVAAKAVVYLSETLTNVVDKMNEALEKVDKNKIDKVISIIKAKAER
jgi:hypothetical protein|nr:MAG TPA: hypothetical protein [Caudoviricetes sp.]